MFTIVAAFQGVSIYVVLVLLTKNVRDELIKWIINNWECLVRSSNYILITFYSFPFTLQVRSTVILNPMISTDAVANETNFAINNTKFLDNDLFFSFT